MLKAEMVEIIQKSVSGVAKKDANTIYVNLFAMVGESLQAGDDVTLGHIGTLKVATRAARQGRNPRTGVAIAIPEKKIVVFHTSAGMKKALND
ncbi:MAG: HU family DNA-binding protein [Pedobacter sp.]|uniref:HU family DNA-binding protein n=1 Tax=Pedobacter sp. TaxID=1411316 RepID=UPI0035621ADF